MEHWGEEVDGQHRCARNTIKMVRCGRQKQMTLRAAGMKVVGGTDTGQTRHLIGYFNHSELESMSRWDDPPETIKAATRNSAAIGKSKGWGARPQCRLHRARRQSAEEDLHSRRINKVYLRGDEVPRAPWRRSGARSSAPPPDRLSRGRRFSSVQTIDLRVIAVTAPWGLRPQSARAFHQSETRGPSVMTMITATYPLPLEAPQSTPPPTGAPGRSRQLWDRLAARS